jgi:hypothetical protein
VKLEYNLSKLIVPTIVALDSSQLGEIARDTSSEDEAHRDRAKAFLHGLETGNSVLLLCFHHIQELLSHDNSATVENRVEFLKTLPLVATLRPLIEGYPIGSIIDLQAAEIRAAYRNSQADAKSIRDEVALKAFNFESGAEALRPFLESWHELKIAFAEQGIRRRKIVAISRSSFADISTRKVSDLFGRGAESKPRMAQRFDEFHSSLAHDIRERGDRRIGDAEQVATEFLNRLWQLATQAASAPEPAFEILRAAGVCPSEVGPNATVAEVCRLVQFRQKLRILNEDLRLPWAELKKTVTEDKLPSAIIQAAVAVNRPDTHEWKGSDMTDDYLACLSAYADETYVDKRTYEALRRARTKSNQLQGLLRLVKKVTSYEIVKV